MINVDKFTMQKSVFFCKLARYKKQKNSTNQKLVYSSDLQIIKNIYAKGRRKVNTDQHC